MPFQHLRAALTTASLLFVALFISASDSIASSSGRTQSVGLVLSGGGAKGIAHIGVIQALEDNDIPIDYITGTSMGAIVGGLYACGYTPAEMMDLIMSREFGYWSTGKIDQKLTYYFLRPEPTPTLMSLNLAGRDSSATSSVLPVSIISPLPMNFGFMELFSPYTAQCGGDFNKLFVPFRCITSDVTNKHKVVCADGSVGDAIRASMNFPIVFHPIYRDGAMLYDGGIYENYPIATMRKAFAPDIMIGVDVSSGSDKESANESIIDQLETMIIQGGVQQMPKNMGIGMHIDLKRFGLLDFAAAREIYKIGYDHAMSMMDSIRSRVTSRIPAEARTLRRRVFKSKTPELVFDSVSVEGCNSPSQNRLLESFFRPRKGESVISLPEARLDYYRAISTGKLSNFVPQATQSPSSRRFNLHLQATIKNRFDLGVGAYVSTSTSSMLFFSGAYRTLSYNSLDLRLNGWLGQSYMAAAANSSISLRGHRPSAFTMQIVGSRQKYSQSDRLFYQTSQPTFVTSDELFLQVKYGTAISLPWKFEAGLGAGHLVDRYYTDFATEYASGHRDHTSRNLLKAFAAFERSTLNNDTYPTSGAFYRLNAMALTGRYKITPADGSRTADHFNRSFLQFEFSSRNFMTLSRIFSLGVETDLLASTRHLMPNYFDSIVDAPAFNPTPSSHTLFDPDFRAYSFAAAGIVPVVSLNDMFQIRATGWAFMPVRKILDSPDGRPHTGKWINQPRFFGELAGVVTLPFAAISAYGRYTSTPAGRWNFGISIGLFILAPRFCR